MFWWICIRFPLLNSSRRNLGTKTSGWVGNFNRHFLTAVWLRRFHVLYTVWTSRVHTACRSTERSSDAVWNRRESDYSCTRSINYTKSEGCLLECDAVWFDKQVPEFRRYLQMSSSISQMEEEDSSDFVLPLLQAAVTHCSLPSETQICFSSSFKHIRNLRRYSQNCAQRLLASSCISIRLCCPSVRVEKLGSHWTNFHEIKYFSIFRKYVEKIQGTVKSDKNNGYFTWRPIE